MENTAVNSNMTNRETEAKGLNTEINPLFSILDKSEEFRRLQAGLCGGKGARGTLLLLSRCGAFSGKGTAAQCPQLCSVTGIDVKTTANGSTADKR